MINPTQHGTLTGYTYGCRCRACSQARRDYQKRWRQRARDEEIPPTVKHGRRMTYLNYACRCEHCCEAAAAFRREYKARRAS